MRFLLRGFLTVWCFLAAGVAWADAPASILVTLPYDAVLSIDDTQTTSTGAIRRFVTPPIAGPGKYIFQVTANGQAWAQTVHVKPGEETVVSLTPPVFGVEPAPKTFGVEPNKITPGQLSANGIPISRAEASKLIEGDGNGNWRPTDKDLPYLTLIGSQVDCQKVMQDLASPVLASLVKGRWRVQEYTPDQWAVQNAGFVTSGTPTIYLQQANGIVLHRQDTYNGPEALAAALRKADPNYDATKDPDVTKPALLTGVSPVALGGLAAIGAIVFLGNRKKKGGS